MSLPLHQLEPSAIMALYISCLQSEFISIKLSEVMADIGLTIKVIKKRRRSFQIMEVVDTSVLRLLSKKVTTYNLGSQSEGSTTVDLDSDIDSLYSYQDINVIQDWNNRVEDAQNVLMVQDETTAPGHCLLQVQSNNILILYPNRKFHERDFFKDGKGRLLLKNTCFDDKVVANLYNKRNGPAHSLCGNPAQNDEDNVMAWHCNYWPKEAQQWFVKEGWPTEDLRRECKATGCIIVPVCSKNSQYKDLEWRISTCLVERKLMFSLNITQMRCYVLMKMIIKTFIKPKYHDSISSYICKTVLFHNIHNESSLTWNENHLIKCLTSCLHLLEVFVMAEECPHFIIPGHNLLAGKISAELKYNLVATLNELQNTLVKHLLKIPFDCLGIRLLVKLEASEKVCNLKNTLITPRRMCQIISVKLLRHIALQLSIRQKSILQDLMPYEPFTSQRCFTLVSKFKSMCNKTKNELEKSAYKLFIPFLYSSLASIMASNELQDKKAISKRTMDRKALSKRTLDIFSEGSISDVSSGKLKLASALYCSGALVESNNILKEIEQKYDTSIVEIVCACNDIKLLRIRDGFAEKADTGYEELIKDIISFCVRYLPAEAKCVPHELIYEIFRSTAKDWQHRQRNDRWMDWIVVDSLPYLYFLKYKIYGHLQKKEEQREALSKLDETVKTKPNLGHRETALNLLGQCMEQEKRYDDALHIYIQSLNIRNCNNAAKIHICRMISTLINKKFC